MPRQVARALGDCLPSNNKTCSILENVFACENLRRSINIPLCEIVNRNYEMAGGTFETRLF